MYFKSSNTVALVVLVNSIVSAIPHQCVSTITFTQIVTSTVTVFGSSTFSVASNSAVSTSHIESSSKATSQNSGVTASSAPSISSSFLGTGYFPNNTASVSTFVTQGTGTLSSVFATERTSKFTLPKTPIRFTTSGSSRPSTASIGGNSGASTSIGVSIYTRTSLQTTLVPASTSLPGGGTTTVTSYRHLPFPTSSQSIIPTSSNSGDSPKITSSIIPISASGFITSSLVISESTTTPYASTSSTTKIGGDSEAITSQQSSVAQSPSGMTSTSTLPLSSQTPGASDQTPQPIPTYGRYPNHRAVIRHHGGYQEAQEGEGPWAYWKKA